jgi:hypothetical protein
MLDYIYYDYSTVHVTHEHTVVVWNDTIKNALKIYHDTIDRNKISLMPGRRRPKARGACVRVANTHKHVDCATRNFHL